MGRILLNSFIAVPRSIEVVNGKRASRAVLVTHHYNAKTSPFFKRHNGTVGSYHLAAVLPSPARLEKRKGIQAVVAL